MTGKAQPDAHFGGYASEYSRFRPTYPERLFVRLREVAGREARVLDCCTGSGQAAVGLRRAFDRVVASDVSPRQLAAAPRLPDLLYVAAAAEDTPFAPGTFDLVTVGQALHWLDFDRFFAEVRRIVRPRGVLAAWCYDLARVPPAPGEGRGQERGAEDEAVHRLYGRILGAHWLPERRFVETAYATISVPFEPIETTELRMERRWSLAELLGYLRTWSAARIYAEERGTDPVALVEPELAAAWGDADRRRVVEWPVTLRLFRVG